MDTRDHLIETFIENTVRQEQSVSPDPFLRTRLIQRLEDHALNAQPSGKFNHRLIFQPVVITLGLLIAAAAGILLGWNQGRLSQYSERDTRMRELRSTLYIQDFADEDTYVLTQE